MNIGYHYPSLDHIYAQRTIWKGFQDAWEDLGHRFFTFTNTDDLDLFLLENHIDIFFTSSHFYYQKVINLETLTKYRQQGLKVFVKIDWRNSPFSSNSIREGLSLSQEKDKVEQIKKGLLGDYFYSVFESDDWRVDGFTKITGQKYYCIPLACNPKQQYFDYAEEFCSKLSFLGSWSRNKVDDFKNLLYPLKGRGLVLYGQDRTIKDRIIGNIQRVGQYFNIKVLAKIQKPKLPFDAERKIYSSTAINLNIHERQQKKYGGDCNERAFKIMACGGFQITDNVACLSKYFKDGEEIVIAKDKDDWFTKIEYYMNHPEERKRIAEAGRKRVLQDHTYHNRVQQILDIYCGR